MKVEGTGGWTAGSEGLENAYSYLSETYDKNANNRIFIFTDGDFNFGITSEGGLSDFIYKKRETGIDPQAFCHYWQSLVFPFIMRFPAIHHKII